MDVVVTREPIAAGAPIRRRALAIRRVPRRFAPGAGIASPGLLEGQKAAVDIGADTDLTAAMVGDGRRSPVGPSIGKGERVAQVVALGSPDLVTQGSHVDVLVTPEPRPTERGETVLALEDVEVLDAAAVPEQEVAGHDAVPGERVAVSLLVTLRQAVYLAAAQDFARELRLLPRAVGDRTRGRAGLSMGATPP